jgi:hypothetical protein
VARSGYRLIAGLTLFLSAGTQPAAQPTRHFAPNANFDAEGRFEPGQFGFDLSDVSQRRDLDRLPDGVLGLVWVGQCNGADARFITTVTPFLQHPRVFGFYLMDDPDPRWWRGRHCTPEHLREEADWIRSHAPDAKTFIMLMNLGTSREPSFRDAYNVENTHLDLFGLCPYPCRTETGECDFTMIDRYVDAAVAAAIPLDRIVPTYQTFGGGNWIDDQGGHYEVPSRGHEIELISHWANLVPNPVFDYAYSWGAQQSDVALENSPPLRAVLAEHNSTVGNTILPEGPRGHTR